MLLENKKIILGVSGGIAAYKAAELLRLLRQKAAVVQVVMTAAAQQFITPLTMQTLSGHLVRHELFDLATEHVMSHIELARWADMILIAPASANMLAKLAQGMADNLLSTLCLATQAPIFLAPAMNRVMWENTLTQANITRLQQHHFHILGPASGEQACGELGFGRLLEPLDIISQLEQFDVVQHFKHKKIVITAGPTREALDPVRYFSNYSSGKMGYALATAAVQQGATVVLISGPTHLPVPQGLTFIAVNSALEMQQAVMAQLAHTDIFIAAAAVADYRPQVMQKNKIKKQQAILQCTLLRNPDILQAVADSPQRPSVVVGFAAESEDLLINAQKKLQQKGLDLIIANDIGHGKMFDRDEGEVVILGPTGVVATLNHQPKIALAMGILASIHALNYVTNQS